MKTTVKAGGVLALIAVLIWWFSGVGGRPVAHEGTTGARPEPNATVTTSPVTVFPEARDEQMDVLRAEITGSQILVGGKPTTAEQIARQAGDEKLRVRVILAGDAEIGTYEHLVKTLDRFDLHPEVRSRRHDRRQISQLPGEDLPTAKP